MIEPRERDEAGYLSQEWIDWKEQQLSDLNESEARWLAAFRVRENNRLLSETFFI